MVNKILAGKKLLQIVVSAVGPKWVRWWVQEKAVALRIEALGKADALRIEAQGKAEASIIEARGKARASLIEARGKVETSHVEEQKQTGAACVEEEKATYSQQLINTEWREAESYLADESSSFHREYDLSEEIKERVDFQERKRQRNIGNVVRMAEEELGDKEVPNHDIDADWATRFFSEVQDVTSEQMQIIWAKILAGEVETPGRTSLHTLAILKNMSQHDAEIFENIARFVLLDFILRDKRYTSGVPGFPSDTTLLQFDAYGLISVGAPNLVKEVDVTRRKSIEIYDGSTVFVISRRNTRSPSVISIPTHSLTSQGKELCHIVKPEVSMDYLYAFSRFLYGQGCILARGHAAGTGPDPYVTHLEPIEPRIPK